MRIAATLQQAFEVGRATSVSSQDSANDNPYMSVWSRLAFEVGAYFMRDGREAPKRVERGGWKGNQPVLFVDGNYYHVEDTAGGLRIVCLGSL